MPLAVVSATTPKVQFDVKHPRPVLRRPLRCLEWLEPRGDIGDRSGDPVPARVRHSILGCRSATASVSWCVMLKPIRNAVVLAAGVLSTSACESLADPQTAPGEAELTLSLAESNAVWVGSAGGYIIEVGKTLSVTFVVENEGDGAAEDVVVELCDETSCMHGSLDEVPAGQERTVTLSGERPVVAHEEGTLRAYLTFQGARRLVWEGHFQSELPDLGVAMALTSAHATAAFKEGDTVPVIVTVSNHAVVAAAPVTRLFICRDPAVYGYPVDSCNGRSDLVSVEVPRLEAGQSWTDTLAYRVPVFLNFADVAQSSFVWVCADALSAVDEAGVYDNCGEFGFVGLPNLEEYCGARPIALGVPTSGVLETGDCRPGTMTVFDDYADYFSFTGVANRDYHIRIEADGINVAIITPRGGAVTGVAKFASGDVGAFRVPADGTYYIVIGSGRSESYSVMLTAP